MGLSPDQVRRTYHKSRQRVLERRERANTDISRERLSETSPSPTKEVRDRSATTLSLSSNESYLTQYDDQRRLSNSSSNLSTSSTELRGDRSASSLTDISVTTTDKPTATKKPTSTTVIRRKKGNKFPRDPTKRLSAPLMDSLKLPITPECGKDNSVASLRKQLASMSVPDLSTTRHERSFNTDRLQVSRKYIHFL